MRHPELGCSLSDHFAIEATLSFRPLTPTPSHSETNVNSNGALHPPKLSSSNTTAIPRADSEIIVDDIRLTKVDRIDNDNDSRLDARTMSTHIPTYALQNGTFLNIPNSPSPRPSVDYTRSSPTMKQFDAQHLSHVNTDDSPAFPISAYDEILSVVHKYDRRERAQIRWRARHFFASVAVLIACLVGVWFNPYNYLSFILILVSSLGLVAGTIDGLLALLFFKSELRALKEFQWEVMNAKNAIGGVNAPPQDEGEDDERSW